ncbi:hypothetical protein NESM_000030900 [Novymonas esmeraldas]|uniref:Uncharacterized protein n=1 Tax=Novymonas esmeraldas TaxID=1808958 RepID=A0AAW0F3K2_9TRYP
MSDAAAYLRSGRRMQSTLFGKAGVARTDGVASGGISKNELPALRDVAPDASASGLVVVRVNDAQRNLQQLPMKKRKPATKRSRSDSDDEDSAVVAATVAESDGGGPTCAGGGDDIAPPSASTEAVGPSPSAGELNLTSVASPTAPVPPVEGVAQRISLLSKWFPASLQEHKLDAAVAPATAMVEATVDRVTKMRDYVLILRYGIEDVEALLEETRRSHASLWVGGDADPSRDEAVPRRLYWDLRGTDVRKLVRAVGVSPFAQALAEFSEEDGAEFRRPAAVATAVHRIASRRRRVAAPLEYRMASWHSYLDRHGPESGSAPRLSEVLWIGAAGTSAMFTAAASRLLRGARAGAEPAAATAAPEQGDEASDTGDTTGWDGPRFFDNTEAAVETMTEAESVTSGPWLLHSPVAFPPALSEEQRSLLSFLRFLMPTAQPSGSRRCSTGYGVWLFAAFSALDIPLDPDTDRLAHELFRTCCRHLRTLAAWKGVSGSTRDSLLRQFRLRSSQAGAAAPTYASLDDIRQEDVRAVYTVVIVLARFFRQNQDRFLPL